MKPAKKTNRTATRLRLCSKTVSSVKGLSLFLGGFPLFERCKLGPIPDEQRYYYHSFEAGAEHLQELVDNITASLASHADGSEPMMEIRVRTKQFVE